VNSTLDALAVAPDGTALLTWSAVSDAQTSILGDIGQLATRPPGGSFTAVTTPSGPGQFVPPYSPPIAAIDPMTAVPFLAWPAPQTGNQPIDAIELTHGAPL
jgi:hypothetical protein